MSGKIIKVCKNILYEGVSNSLNPQTCQNRLVQGNEQAFWPQFFKTHIFGAKTTIEPQNWHLTSMLFSELWAGGQCVSGCCTTGHNVCRTQCIYVVSILPIGWLYATYHLPAEWAKPLYICKYIYTVYWCNCMYIKPAKLKPSKINIPLNWAASTSSHLVNCQFVVYESRICGSHLLQWLPMGFPMLELPDIINTCICCHSRGFMTVNGEVPPQKMWCPQQSRNFFQHHLVGGFNPSEKYARQIIIISPGIGVKNIWNHHLVMK